MDGKNKALYFLQMIENENDPCVIQPHQATGTIEGLDKELTTKKKSPQTGSGWLRGVYTH